MKCDRASRLPRLAALGPVALRFCRRPFHIIARKLISRLAARDWSISIVAPEREREVVKKSVFTTEGTESTEKSLIKTRFFSVSSVLSVVFLNFFTASRHQNSPGLVIRRECRDRHRRRAPICLMTAQTVSKYPGAQESPGRIRAHSQSGGILRVPGPVSPAGLCLSQATIPDLRRD